MSCQKFEQLIPDYGAPNSMQEWRVVKQDDPGRFQEAVDLMESLEEVDFELMPEIVDRIFATMQKQTDMIEILEGTSGNDGQ